ncbi:MULTISPECIES: sulfite exporter TauE/SafE family protein [unclassified Caballeronia]|uniref:sulfite exporter TauE/SafE family protein n=1 Tax=unclassified Caballeronia TaxID=2646786 RepID=UPI002861B770|nr:MULTISPECIES: sulfite exporter TauE/SafE family protein [unclassified Caballeronia]MDR5754183.1 sulfite exporter TauE/SafE family protein [Caballeronia sp. LZ024]MDR5840561.1 sulfite exporter TauE/SafE family protein [Caballeronia sp. LZ031]
MSFPHIDLLYSASGLAVGFLVGLTGVGGGSLMTPLLVLLFGIHPATAVGTDLLYAAATKTAGTLVHGIKGSVDWRITGRLAAGSVPAAAITLVLLHYYGVHSPGAARVIQLILGTALLITAVSLVFRPQLARLAYRKGTGRPEHPQRTAAWTVLTGAILGVLVSITSVGAGAIGVTVLLLLYPRLATARIVGSDIAHAVPLTLIAGTGHWMLGSVDWALLASLLVGSLPGIAIGSMLSSKAPEALLRNVLAATLLLVGVKLVLS